MDVKQFKKKYYTSFIVILILVSLSQILIQSALENALNDSKIINLSGRQRMLSQKIAKQVLFLYKTVDRSGLVPKVELVSKDLQEFITIHTSLNKRDQKPFNKGKNSDEVQAFFHEISPHFLILVNSVEKSLLLLEKEQYGSELENLVNLIQEKETIFLEMMNEIVFAYDREAKQRIQVIRYLELAIYLFTLILIFYEIFRIITPSIKAISKYVQNKEQTLSRLESAHSELSNRYISKSEYIAQLSRDIKSPLMLIKNLIEIFRKEQKNKKNVNHQLESVDSLLENARVLVNDIQDLSKLETEDLDIDRKSFDLRESLHKVFEILKFKAEVKDIEYRLVIDDAVPVLVVSDALRLTQILMHLIDFAILHTFVGEVSLVVKVEDEVDENTINISFTIVCLGTEFDEEKLTSIFQSFQIGEFTKKDEDREPGLNLISKLLEKLNGFVLISTDQEKVSKFKLIFPFERVLEAQEHENTNSANLYRNMKALIVEENQTNGFVIRNFLEEQNIRVSLVSSGREAIDLFKGSDFDVVLISLYFSNQEGFEVVRSLRVLEKAKQQTSATIFAMAPYLDVDLKKKVSEAGFDLCLEKPIQRNDLIQKLKETRG